MKSLLSISMMLVLPGLAHAADGVNLSAGGGALFADPLEVLDSSWAATVRGGVWVKPNLAVEADLGLSTGQTTIGTPDTFPYTSFTPRLGILGRIPFVNQDGDTLKLEMTLAAGLGIWGKSVGDDGALDLPVGDKLDVDFLGNAGPGAMFSLTETVSIRTDLRFLLSLGGENFQNRGDAFLSWEWTTGVNLQIGGPKDEDKDGIVDEEDSCIDEPEDLDGFKDEDGCPDDDNDGDGIVDADDAECPNEAEDMDGFEDTDGCPDLNNDGDDLADAEDECPDIAGRKSLGGCPDNDEDDIRNSEDECEDEAGPKEAQGCPDGDGDRVPDYRDACPEEPGWEKAIALVSDGCKGRVYLTKKFLVVTEQVQFDSGKATIKAASHELLDEIFAALKSNKNLKKLLIAGHTDDRGDDEKNMKLSEDRALSVVAYLKDKGLAEGRMKAKGFGETEPIGDNKTSAGREENRRVEFRIKDSSAAKRVKRAKNTNKDDEGDAEKKDAGDDKEEKAEDKKEEKAEDKKE